MLLLRSTLFILLSLFLGLGCSQQPSGSSSSSSSALVMRMPNQTLHAPGLGGFSTSACYAVSISAADISSTPATECDSAVGVFGGLVAPGGSIQLEADRGLNRKIEIFYVLSDNGCNSFNPTLGLGKTYGSNNVFRVGVIENVAFDNDEVSVPVEISLADSSNSLETLMSAPASCAKSQAPVPITKSSARFVQGSYKGPTPDGGKIHVRIQDKSIQSINIGSPSVTPAKLGDQQ